MQIVRIVLVVIIFHDALVFASKPLFLENQSKFDASTLYQEKKQAEMQKINAMIDLLGVARNNVQVSSSSIPQQQVVTIRQSVESIIASIFEKIKDLIEWKSKNTKIADPAKLVVSIKTPDLNKVIDMLELVDVVKSSSLVLAHKPAVQATTKNSVNKVSPQVVVHSGTPGSTKKIVTQHVEQNLKKIQDMIELFDVAKHQVSEKLNNIVAQTVVHSSAKVPSVAVSNVDQQSSWKKFAALVHEPAQPLQAPVGLEFEKNNLVRKKWNVQSIPVYQLDVLQQSGGDWTCGFHALKNVLYVMHGLQKNPMTQVVAIELKRQLQNVHVFNRLLVGSATIQNPSVHSWLNIAQSVPNFIQNDGIFPGDQRILIQKMLQGQATIPDAIYIPLLSKIFPVNSLDPNLMLSDDVLVVPEAVHKCLVNQWPAVAFTLPKHFASQHFIGIILHRMNTAGGLEIFIVDSLNTELNSYQQVLNYIISWYRDIDNVIVDLFMKSEQLHQFQQYMKRLKSIKETEYMKNEGFIATLGHMFRAIQGILLAAQILNISKQDLPKYDLVLILQELMCFYYKALDRYVYNPQDPFFYVNIAHQKVLVADATDGILPKTYGEFKPMLEEWANALGLPSLQTCF